MNVSPGASLYFAVALVCGAAVFLTAGALASQLAPTRRRAAGYCAGALGICYALRMTADSGTGLAWLRWLSPLGWIEELRPLTSPQPIMLIPIAALVALMAGLAVNLARSRDLGASVIADRSSARPHTSLLTGPTGLAIRLTRGVLIGWGLSIALLGLLMGLIAKSAGSALTQNAGDRDTFAKMGFRGSGAVQYMAITFLILALLVGLIAAGQLTAARSEEAEGRVDHLLVRPVSRYSWLAGRLAVATGCLLIAGLIGGITSWLAAASQDTGVGLGTLIDAGLNVVPPAVFVLGVGALILGVHPRAVAAVSYGLLAWSFLVELVGRLRQRLALDPGHLPFPPDGCRPRDQPELDQQRDPDHARPRRGRSRRRRLPPPRPGRRMTTAPAGASYCGEHDRGRTDRRADVDGRGRLVTWRRAGPAGDEHGRTVAGGRRRSDCGSSGRIRSARTG